MALTILEDLLLALQVPIFTRRAKRLPQPGWGCFTGEGNDS